MKKVFQSTIFLEVKMTQGAMGNAEIVSHIYRDGKEMEEVAVGRKGSPVYTSNTPYELYVEEEDYERALVVLQEMKEREALLPEDEEDRKDAGYQRKRFFYRNIKAIYAAILIGFAAITVIICAIASALSK